MDREEVSFHDREEVTILDSICTGLFGGWDLRHHIVIYIEDYWRLL
jgi:hypothetical protein